MDALVNAMFLQYLDEKRASKFRQSVQYYLNGTASGFLKYCAPAVTPKEKKNIAQNNNENIEKENDNDLEVSGTGFASETTEQEVCFSIFLITLLVIFYYRRKHSKIIN